MQMVGIATSIQQQERQLITLSVEKKGRTTAQLGEGLEPVTDCVTSRDDVPGDGTFLSTGSRLCQASKTTLSETN